MGINQEPLRGFAYVLDLAGICHVPMIAQYLAPNAIQLLPAPQHAETEPRVWVYKVRSCCPSSHQQFRPRPHIVQPPPLGPGDSHLLASSYSIITSKSRPCDALTQPRTVRPQTDNVPRTGTRKCCLADSVREATLACSIPARNPRSKPFTSDRAQPIHDIESTVV